MRFLLDQDVYQITYNFLTQNHYDVIRVKDISCDRAKDEDILKEAVKRSCTLITRDKGFGSLVFFSKMSCTGIILLRHKTKDIDKVHSQLQRLLKNHSFEQIKGSFITVEADKYRIRHLPLSVSDE